MKDEFQGYKAGLTAPAYGATEIVPNDAVDLDVATRALFVGTSGDVVVQMVSGETVTLTNVQAGVIYPVRVARVLQTGTSAGGLVGLR